jgi:hypothetical protein
MEYPPYLADLPPIPSPQALILQEVRQANQYLEILIEMFVRKFPEVLSDELGDEIKKVKKARKIGFQPEAEQSDPK